MTRKSRPLIYVFCEGESEQAYTKYLKNEFNEVSVIKYPPNVGLFEYARNVFENNPKYKNNIEITDEIWFFFDTEVQKAAQWEKNLKIIKKLRNLRKPKIKVRLLMTTACIEYWLLLHYERKAPGIVSQADKESIKNQVKQKVQHYEKGNYEAICEIAKNYETAVDNGKWTLSLLLDIGLPSLEDNDGRNSWLYKGTHTFTTVHEAIEFLINLRDS